MSVLAAGILLSSLLVANGAVTGDLVTKLPGYSGDLKSKHYSGCK
jgi:hypothetical protein